MSNGTSDVSQFCDFDFFEWVMFWDETAPCLDGHFELGRYLRPSIDVDPAMMPKILKENGQVMHKSTYQSLTQDELELEECNEEWSLFMESLYQRLVPCAVAGDLANLGAEDILQYDPYENESLNEEAFLICDEEPEVTPEWGDQYLNAKLLLLRGDKMARVWAVHQKHDANGNSVGKSNMKSILDTPLYEGVFLGGEITPLKANIIADPMYTQCDSNGNECLWLKAFVVHRKNDSALNVEDQKKDIHRRVSLRKSTDGWDICCE